MGDPDEYSATNIALDSMQENNRLRYKIEELEARNKLLENNVARMTGILNEFIRIFYLKESEKDKKCMTN